MQAAAQPVKKPSLILHKFPITGKKMADAVRFAVLLANHPNDHAIHHTVDWILKIFEKHPEYREQVRNGACSIADLQSLFQEIDDYQKVFGEDKIKVEDAFASHRIEIYKPNQNAPIRIFNKENGNVIKLLEVGKDAYDLLIAKTT